MKNAEKMLVENENLVFFTISRYFPSYIHDEDVRQIGRIALWKACEKYDPANGAAFSTYCTRAIQNEVKKYLQYFTRCGRNTPTISLDDSIKKDSPRDNYQKIADKLDVDFIDTEAISRHLTPKHKKLLRIYLDGHNCQEAAKLFGVSCNSITKWKKEIKAIIAEYA